MASVMPNLKEEVEDIVPYFECKNSTEVLGTPKKSVSSTQRWRGYWLWWCMQWVVSTFHNGSHPIKVCSNPVDNTENFRDLNKLDTDDTFVKIELHPFSNSTYQDNYFKYINFLKVQSQPKRVISKSSKHLYMLFKTPQKHQNTRNLEYGGRVSKKNLTVSLSEDLIDSQEEYREKTRHKIWIYKLLVRKIMGMWTMKSRLTQKQRHSNFYNLQLFPLRPKLLVDLESYNRLKKKLADQETKNSVPQSSGNLWKAECERLKMELWATFNHLRMWPNGSRRRRNTLNIYISNIQIRKSFQQKL